MTEFIYRVWFALPASEENRIILQKLGVAIFVEELSGSDALALLDENIDVLTLKDQYPSLIQRIDDESRNFQDGWSLSSSGFGEPATPLSGMTHYLGDFRATQLTWDKIQSQFAENSKYIFARFTLHGLYFKRDEYTISLFLCELSSRPETTHRHSWLFTICLRRL